MLITKCKQGIDYHLIAICWAQKYSYDSCRDSIEWFKWKTF